MSGWIFIAIEPCPSRSALHYQTGSALQETPPGFTAVLGIGRFDFLHHADVFVQHDLPLEVCSPGDFACNITAAFPLTQSRGTIHDHPTHDMSALRQTCF